MSNHFFMGALNKITKNYEYPKIADKKNKYTCPSCEKDVIFRNGKIKRPHFAHKKSENPCSYYDKPCETQIHKDAKLLFKTLFDNKKKISLHRKCGYCNKDKENFININTENYKDNQIHIEYKFIYNNSQKSADVALVNNDKIVFIFEICYKHKTKEENRPEPWFEINAEIFVNETNLGKNINENGEICIDCIRDYKCGFCKEKEETQQRLYEEQQKLYAKQQYETNKIERELEQMREEERIVREEERLRVKKENELIRLERIRKENYCKCGIQKKNICDCENPVFKTIVNNLYCKCNRWKCRCE